jgi:predicted secreted protein
MTANVGRAVVVYWGDESPQPAVAGIQEQGITVNGEAVDITNNDSDGWRSLLDIGQINSLDISASGVLINDTLRADAIAGATATGRRMQDATFEYPLEAGQSTPAKIEGTFYLQGYAETGSHDGAITFECSFMSHGAVTYTPGA